MDLGEFLKAAADVSTDDLVHHGIKGMHWGVRKAKDSSEGQYSAKEFAGRVESLSSKDKAVLKAAGMSPSQAPAMEAKYGPDSNKDSKRHLTPAQKKLIAVGVVAAVLVGASIYESKTNDTKLINGMVKNGIKKPTAEYIVKSDAEKNIRAAAFDASKLGKEDLTFPAGHIFSRVSTEAEKEIRDTGFYASHSPEDTERYKAVLPVYWKLWGLPNTSGYVNHYASSNEVRIASEKTLYDTVKSHLGDSITVVNPGVGVKKMKLSEYLSANMTHGVSKSADELVDKAYNKLVGAFADPSDSAVAHISKVLQEAGYHGIIDGNDAGSLSASPVKFITSAGFKIVGNDSLWASEIADAQNALTALAHILSMQKQLKPDVRVGGEMDLGEFLESAADVTPNELAHHGVKGMHWGVREGHPDGGDKPSSDEVRAARLRVHSSIKTLNQHGQALILAKNDKERQQHYDAIQRISKKVQASGDLEKATSRSTRRAKVIGGIVGGVATAGIPVGIGAGVAVAHASQKLAAMHAKSVVNSYANSKIEDYA